LLFFAGSGYLGLSEGFIACIGSTLCGAHGGKPGGFPGGLGSTFGSGWYSKRHCSISFF
jgi:hypothetical protein